MYEHHICRARDLRLRYGISQAELAKKIFVSQQTISKIQVFGNIWDKTLIFLETQHIQSMEFLRTIHIHQQ